MTADIGHNSTVAGAAQTQLKSIVERIERLEEEKDVIAIDIREVYAEAKGNGFDVKILRKLVRERKREQSDVLEEQEILDLYKHALGMLSDTPLGEAAIAKAAGSAS
jgi:uncharacterized protein (UPF0335 family)